MIGLPVLVLNQSYQPLNVCTVRRAVVLLTGSKAELLEKGYGEVQSPSMETPIPSVIRLMYLVRKPFLRKRLSRKGIFLRDKYRCLYCSRGATQLTIDHVVPRYREAPILEEMSLPHVSPVNSIKLVGHHKKQA